MPELMSLPPSPIVSTTRANQLHFFLTVAARRWIWILLGTVLGSAGLGAYGLLTFDPPIMTHVAQTDIGIRKTLWEREFFSGSPMPQMVSLTADSLVSRLAEDTSWSEDVARALIQNDIAQGNALGARTGEDEIMALAGEIQYAVQFAKADQSDLVKITALADSREEARRRADFTARVIVEQNRNYVQKQQELLHEFTEQQLHVLSERLDRAHAAEWEYRQKMNFMDPDKVDAEMNRLRDEMNKTAIEKSNTEEEMKRVQEQLMALNADLPMSLDDISDEVVNELIGELEALQKDYLLKSVVNTPEHPEMVELGEQIEEQRAAVAIAFDQVIGSETGGTGAWDERRDLRKKYMALQLDGQTLNIRTKTIAGILEQMTASMPNLAEMGREYRQLKYEAEQIRGQFDKLVDREFEAKTALQRESAQVERVSDVKDAPGQAIGNTVFRPHFNFLLGAVLGFLAGFMLAFLFENMDTSIRTMEDVAEYIGLEVIGQVPKMKFVTAKKSGRRRRGTYVAVTEGDQVDACIVTQHDPKSPISEAYRTLRTNFQLATFQQRPRSVMITSAVPAEGKTTTAVNFAVAMADSGMKVLMIDTDLRRPNVHHVLKMERGAGLADVLREGLDVRSVIRPTRVENLWMISSGRVPPNPSELIGSERMERLMNQLGSVFDLVVCDAPSVLVVTDPVLLSTQVDTCIMVVTVNNARRETIVRAKKLLEQAKTNVVGVVLNGLEASRRHHYYYYYYYDDRSRGRRGWSHI